MAGDVGDVYHAHIHADVAHVAGLLSVDDAVSVPVAQSAVESVGIANGDGGDARGAHQLSSTAVAHGFRFGHVVYLQYGGLKLADGVEQAVAHRTDAIEAEAQAHHVVMILGEAFDACRVAYVAQYLVGEGGLQGGGGFVEAGGLQVSEGVELGAVAACKMREHRAGNHSRLTAEATDEAGHLVGTEAQAAHARVDLDMYGVVQVAFTLARANHLFQQGEAVDFRFQIVLEEGLEGCQLGVHHEDAGGDASLA